MYYLEGEDGQRIKSSPTMWGLLVTAKKSDGTRFKKAEADSVKPGTIVYRDKFVKGTYSVSYPSKTGDTIVDYDFHTWNPSRTPFKVVEDD